MSLVITSKHAAFLLAYKRGLCQYSFMNWNIVRFIAFRYMWPGRSDGFLKVILSFSFLGITLGVATLIIVMSVMNGFRIELSKKILDFNSHLSVYDTRTGFQEAGSAIEDIEKLPEVLSVLPTLEGQAMLMSKEKSVGVLVKAFPFRDLEEKSFIYDKLIRGDFTAFDTGEPIVVIGAALARKLSLVPGDNITLVAPQGNVTPFGTMPRFERFKIGGVFEVGMHEYDQSIIFMPYKKAEQFLNSVGRIGHLEVYLKNPYETDTVIEKIQKRLWQPLKFLSWYEAHASFFEVIRIERNVMFIILSLIVLIAAFNIISGLVIMVKDKTSDIAILRTMGLSSYSVLGIFCMVGSFIGILGSVCGFFMGMLVSHHLESIRCFFQSLLGTDLFKSEFYFLSKLPSVVVAQDVILIVSLSILLSLLASLYPAYRASKINPVRALRQNG